MEQDRSVATPAAKLGQEKPMTRKRQTHWQADNPQDPHRRIAAEQSRSQTHNSLDSTRSRKLFILYSDQITGRISDCIHSRNPNPKFYKRGEEHL